MYDVQFSAQSTSGSERGSGYPPEPPAAPRNLFEIVDKSFLGMLRGENTGKMVVRIAD